MKWLVYIMACAAMNACGGEKPASSVSGAAAAKPAFEIGPKTILLDRFYGDKRGPRWATVGPNNPKRLEHGTEVVIRCQLQVAMKDVWNLLETTEGQEATPAQIEGPDGLVLGGILNSKKEPTVVFALKPTATKVIFPGGDEVYAEPWPGAGRALATRFKDRAKDPVYIAPDDRIDCFDFVRRASQLMDGLGPTGEIVFARLGE